MDAPTALFDRYRRHGDLDALGRAFDLLSPRLLALALHLTGNAADAEDALQAAFVVAMQKSTAFDPRQPVGPWLAGVLAGEANNLRRRERRRRGTALDDATSAEALAVDADVVAAAERQELVAQLRTHVDALPQEQRQVLLLQLQHGLQPAEIAEVLGVAPGTVRMRLHRGLHALRRVLPAGLVALAIGGTARRGIAAVRDAVLEAAAAETVAAGGATVLLGGVMLKKVALAACALAAGMLLWRAVAPTPAGPTPPPVHAAGADARATTDGTSDTLDATPPAAVADPSAADPRRTPVATEPGSLRVTVRGYEGPRPDEDVAVLLPESGTGTPLPGVSVQLRLADRRERPYDARAVRAPSDVAGVATFEGLAPGIYCATVSGGGSSADRRVEVRPGEAASLELLVGFRGVLRGRVVDPDARPVAGAELWVGSKLDTFTAPETRVRLAATSAADGTFALPFLRQEDFACARRAGFAASRSHPLQQMGDGEVVLQLGRETCSLAGVLVDDVGAPVAGAVVAIDPTDGELRRASDGTMLGPQLGSVTRSDARGAFSFEGLTAGTFALSAQRLPNATAAATVRLTGATHDELRLTMPRRAVVQGRVLRPDGRPCADVHVGLHYADGSGHPDVTDADGTFHFAGVRLQPFSLVAARIGSERRTERSLPAPPLTGVDIDLVYDEQPMLRGQLRAENGLVLDGYHVSTGGEGHVREATCDDLGRFRICDVAAGEHELRVHRVENGAVIHRARVVADVEAKVQVPLDAVPFGEVRGRVVGPGGSQIEVVFLRLPDAGYQEGPPPGESTFRFGLLQPGSHVLHASAPGFVRRTVAFGLAEREQKDLGDVVLEPSATLRVRFLRPDGSPWRERPPTPWLARASGTVLVAPAEVQYSTEGDEVVLTGIPGGTYQLRGPDGDELRMPPQTVTLAGGQEQRLTIPVSIGRRRRFEFAGLGDALAPDGRLQVVVLGADRSVVAERTIRCHEGSGHAELVVPIGPLVVEGRVGERVVARAELEVPPDLGAQRSVPVARVP